MVGTLGVIDSRGIAPDPYDDLYDVMMVCTPADHTELEVAVSPRLARQSQADWRYDRTEKHGFYSWGLLQCLLPQ